MNLLYTLTAYPPSAGGAQLYAHYLAQQMLTRHCVSVISQWEDNRTDWLLGTTLRAPGQARNYTINGVNVHRVGLSWREKASLFPSVLFYYPFMSLALGPIVTCLGTHIAPYAKKADIVHNIRIGREGLSYASLQAAKKRDIPFVLTPVHHPRWVGWRYKAYIKLYRMADMVLALTKAEKEVLISLGVREEAVTVTGMGPVLAPQSNPKIFIQKYNIDGPMILFLGQHYRYKGYLQLLEARQLVWRKVPEAHFVFIGPAVGQSEKSFDTIQDRRIHRLGKVDLQEKTDALAACTLLCVPSTQESFGGVYTEAWSFGKPVIGCNVPAIAEVITDQEDGYLVKQEPAQIAEQICYLLLHPELAQVMGAKGRRKVETRYTWQRLGELTEQAYRTVVG